MKGSLDDNYSISSIPVDRWKFERFQEEIYRSEAVQQSLSFPFSSLSTSTPSSGHFFSPLPRWKPVGCNARYTRSRKEISSWEISNRGTIEGRGKGSSRESSLETAAAAPSVPVVQGRCKGRKKGGEMKDERETSFGWLSLVITLLGSIMESVACHGTWASWSVSTIGPRSEKVIDERSRQAPFDFYLGNELIHSSLIFFGESRYNIVYMQPMRITRQQSLR